MPASGPQPDRFVPGAEAADQGHAGDGGWLASTRNNWARLIAVSPLSQPRCHETDDIGVPGRTLLTNATTFALTACTIIATISASRSPRRRPT